MSGMITATIIAIEKQTQTVGIANVGGRTQVRTVTDPYILPCLIRQAGKAQFYMFIAKVKN